mmetsp:Transcript_8383/g.19687  ORF Transcript_8383/g.19687 Transcript_8383/m.19687 type:complete len:716 (+) Transcript_8383:200-2347(+)
MDRQARVKNRAPAPVQISAEQLIREASERQEHHKVGPTIKIHDAEEYQSHLRDRRKHFEDNIRYRREHIGNWVKYARFEEDNREFERARSVFERALEVDNRNPELWLRYAEFEMRNEFVNRARNVLDRAVQLLPRVDFLWYKYAYMEEMVGDIPKCRTVFDRWMEWMPDDNAWMSYARFEGRGGHWDEAKGIMRRYANTYPSARSFLRFAKWAEYEAKDVALARTVYESALVELEPEESRKARVFSRFAAFEERQSEFDRARVIYKHAAKLFHLGQERAEPAMDDDEDVSEWELDKRKELYQQYIAFEKKRGDRAGIEDIVLTGQRAEYEKRVAADPTDYDAWFEYAKLEDENEASSSSSSDSDGTGNKVREVYERAIANIPPNQTEKQYWKRYIYLWIYYALYEEMQRKDLDRASKVYDACLDLIPHASFSFSKIWINAAKLHVRRRDLASARKLLGRAVGMCGKEKIFTEYIALELALGEVDRCRALYTNYLKAMPHNCRAWSKYADLEKSVGETDRCRAIYELAVSQTALDMPEMLWKNYIDFEIDEGEGTKARTLYERLLEKTGHVKVWISYAQFEGTEVGSGVAKGRDIFQRAHDRMKDAGLKEERVLLLDAWRVFEKASGDAASLAKVDSMLPRRVKRKRMRTDEISGAELGYEEYFDYHFPGDDDAGASNLKILEMAAKWKQAQAAEESSSSSSSEDTDSDSSDDDGD